MSAFDDVAVIDLDGSTLEYHPAGEDIPPALAADLRGHSYAVESPLLDHPRLRRAVLRVCRRDDVGRRFGVLHRDDGRDLADIDAAVRSGAAPSRCAPGRAAVAAGRTPSSSSTAE